MGVMHAYAALSAVAFVTADVPITPENVKPGWIALGVVAAMGLGLVVLVRSFIKHSRVAKRPWEGEDSA